MPSFSAVVQLSSLDGRNGFEIDGAETYSLSGRTVSDAGDINGDGFDDVIIGAHLSDANGTYSGAAYVVFGTGGDFPASISSSDLDGSNGFRINGENEIDMAGQSVSAAGDVNGDGFADIIVGADGAGFAGAAYVVFGTDEEFPEDFELSGLDGDNGFRIDGMSGLLSTGRSVSGADDVNGDGFDDLIVSTYSYGYGGTTIAQVVFGSATPLNPFPMFLLDGENGFNINAGSGLDYDEVSVSGAGDINGDGFDDLLVGAYMTDPNGDDSGTTFVVFGSGSGFDPSLDATALNGTNGFRIVGAEAGDYSGVSVSDAGDINGDGVADIIVGARGIDENGNLSGAAYVVFGRRSGFGSTLDLAGIDGTNGFRILGESADNYAGYALSRAGDVNGDGFDDLIVGAPVAGPNSRGAAYVVFGKGAAFTADLELSSLNGVNGFKIAGEFDNGYAGVSVSAAGDVNGDGLDDIIVGADGAEPNGIGYAGASYVIFGIQADLTITGTSGVDRLRGRSGDDTVLGLSGDDRLYGLDGDDTITGGLGRDAQWGGAGADTFVISTWDDSMRAGDAIRDFSQAEGDRIDLSALGDLTWRGTAHFTGEEGEVRYTTTARATYILADEDGDRRADLRIGLNGVFTLTEGDFVL